MKKLFLIAVCVKHREQLDANLTNGRHVMRDDPGKLTRFIHIGN